jgi:hypothetical protein
MRSGSGGSRIQLQTLILILFFWSTSLGKLPGQPSLMARLSQASITFASTLTRKLPPLEKRGNSGKSIQMGRQ